MNFKLIIHLFLFLSFCFTPKVFGQGSVLPFGNDAYHIMDRFEIKTGIPTPYHSSIKYYLRKDVANYAMQVDSLYEDLTFLDVEDLNYIYRDNNEWLNLTEYPTTLVEPKEGEDTQAKMSRTNRRYFARERPILKYFYRTPANFYEAYSKHFHIKINPMIDFKIANYAEDTELIFLNRRGVEIRGGIDDRIFFYSNIIESQARFPNYVNRRINRDLAIPGQGLYKNYESVVFNITNGVDFLNSESYLGFNLTSHVGVQLGYGRNKIGEGIRSVLLSDFANNYFNLKINTRVWRFHYQNIFAELSPIGTQDNMSNNLLPKKYMAAHFLNFEITSKMSIGLYEAVIFGRNNIVELQYLNPLILYRTVEQSIDSPDNVLIGVNFKWNLFKKIQLYSQFILDEFKFDELIIERNGWWANKFGFQGGLKCIDIFGIEHLDAQAEYNSARPYTYTHRDSSVASYSHFNQPLAHPLGANFREIILRLRYQPIHKLVFDGRFFLMNYGEDTDNENWGSNILTDPRTRSQDFGNEIGQGVGTNTMILGLDASYQLFHNFYLEAHYFYRKMDSDDDDLDSTTNYIGGGFRMNIGRTRMDF
ncbi:MAG: hypothetical protein AAF573_20480 [Bacteroidota bacterium]